MANLPFTQQRVLLECINDVARGLNYCPQGHDYRRAHALVRRGLLAPVHGRKGEGIEHFTPTEAGKGIFPTGPGATIP